MAKFWRSQEFRALQHEWELKLAESGFEDIERGGELKTSAGHSARHHLDEITRENRAEYFRQLSQSFHDETSFDDEADRLIMEWTIEGLRIREISERLKECGLYKSDRTTIRFIRRRYEHRWGIKTWKPEEMVSRRVKRRTQ